MVIEKNLNRFFEKLFGGYFNSNEGKVNSEMQEFFTSAITPTDRLTGIKVTSDIGDIPLTVAADFIQAGDGKFYKRNSDSTAWEEVGGWSKKEYIALLTQEGTDAPVATIIRNTLGFSPTWSRENAGVYILSDGVSQFPDQVLFNFRCQKRYADEGGWYGLSQVFSTKEVKLQTYSDDDGNTADELIGTDPLYIWIIIP